MRYLILLLFVIPLVSQSATVRGQTCTVTDLENADPGCCASTMYMCSDLTVSGQSSSNKISCCNENSNCEWQANACHQTTTLCKITDSNKEQNNCILSKATYTSTQNIPGSCKENYTGTCSYTCEEGTISGANDCTECEGGGAIHSLLVREGPHRTRIDKLCANEWTQKCKKEKTDAGYTDRSCYCRQLTDSLGCNIASGGNRQQVGTTLTGTCVDKTLGVSDCKVKCKAGWSSDQHGITHYAEWKHINLCSRGNQNPCFGRTIDKCRLPYESTPHNTTKTGHCVWDTSISCSYQCNNEVWNPVIGCSRWEGASCNGTPDAVHCPIVSNLLHNISRYKKCKSGYTGLCSYTCNNGTLGGSSNPTLGGSSIGCKKKCSGSTLQTLISNEANRLRTLHSDKVFRGDPSSFSYRESYSHSAKFTLSVYFYKSDGVTLEKTLKKFFYCNLGTWQNTPVSL